VTGAQGLLDQATDTIIAPLLTQLEKVTGDPAELRAKAAMWRRSAQGVLEIAAATRDDVSDLGIRWHGAAAEAFAVEMSAHDETFRGMAADMETTAACLSQAADQCEQAERLIQELIRELVEAVAAAATMSAITSVLTAGASVLVGALADAAEAAQFVGRAGELVDKLAEFLRGAKDLLEELRTAQRAVRASQRRNRRLRTRRDAARQRTRPGERRGQHRHARGGQHGGKPTRGQRIAVDGAKQLTQQVLGLDDGFGTLAHTAAADLLGEPDVGPDGGPDNGPEHDDADVPAPSAPSASAPTIQLDTTLVNQADAGRSRVDLPTRPAD
jgi:WXG100 family type VII secretion target